jgi:hypothetical protein
LRWGSVARRLARPPLLAAARLTREISLGYADRIPAYADELASEATVANDVWCILDNTASSAALGDAMALIDAVGRQ